MMPKIINDANGNPEFVTLSKEEYAVFESILGEPTPVNYCGYDPFAGFAINALIYVTHAE
jgi:hypothetical protein